MSVKKGSEKKIGVMTESRGERNKKDQREEVLINTARKKIKEMKRLISFLGPLTRKGID